MRKFVSALALGAGTIAATSASAQVTAFNVDSSTNTEGVSNDISIDFTGTLTGYQILLNLTSGSIVDVPATAGGSDTAPTEFILQFAPELANSTFVTLGGPTLDSSAQTPDVPDNPDTPEDESAAEEPQDPSLVGAGPVDILASATGANQNNTNFQIAASVPIPFFEALSLGLAFPDDPNFPGDVPIVDQEGFLISRITLTPDAAGSFEVLASANEVVSDVQAFDIVDGQIVPEPTTAGLLGIAGLSLLVRRRKTA